MNEVNMLNIGGVDYNIDDQYARDLIAHSENGLDSQSNLPVSSRHYDEGEYLIGQDRYYYEATTDIEIGDVLAEGTNLRKTLLSDEIVSLKNQSSIAVIQCIAKRETGALATSSYPLIGSYLYWDYGLTAGLYETIAVITAGDALTIGVNLKAANKIADTMDGLQDAYNITGAKNLCPNDMQNTVQYNTTYTKNNDGSINIVASGDGPSVNNGILLGYALLRAGTYKLTTFDNGGNESTTRTPLAVKRKSDGVDIARSNSNDGVFTLSTDTEVQFIQEAYTGGALNVRKFPMCRVASITDDTYVPYAMTNRQLTSEISKIMNKKWKFIKEIDNNGTATINNETYEEICIIPNISGNIHYNSFVIPLASFTEAPTQYINVYQDTNNNFYASFTYSNNTLTYQLGAMSGWSRSKMHIYAR